MADDRIRWGLQLPLAGIDSFWGDTSLARRHLASAKGTYALPVAEHAVAFDPRPRSSGTRSCHVVGRPSGLSGREAGVVVGAGGIGLEIVRLLKAFRMHVTVVRRQRDIVPTADATTTADQLITVLPIADLLVNVGRGQLVDTETLTKALAAAQIKGAALDVTAPSRSPPAIRSGTSDVASSPRTPPIPLR